MYHYLKWAALSLFFKRNLRYLILILVSIIGIYGVDAVYRDLVDYFVATGRKESILTLLTVKWTVVIGLTILLLISIMKLGFSKEEKRFWRSRVKRDGEPEEKADPDPIMERLEKFREKKRLKRKSDLLIDRLKKRAERD
jgi:hypothetical protein